MDAPDDRDLLLRYRQGDTSAFEAFYRRHKDGLYRFLLFACGDGETAEELVQRTFVRLVERASAVAWSGPGHPKHWLFKVGINLWRDEARRRRRERKTPEPDWDSVEDPREADLPAGKGRTVEAVRKAVGDLPVKYREVVSLHHLAGLDCKETAKVLGIPEGTVKSRLSKAMDLLAKSLRRYRP